MGCPFYGAGAPASRAGPILQGRPPVAAPLVCVGRPSPRRKASYCLQTLRTLGRVLRPTTNAKEEL